MPGSFSKNYSVTEKIRPRKCKGLYLKEFKGYKFVCNFNQGKLSVMNSKTAKIFDLCDGTRTIEQIWKEVSFDIKEFKLKELVKSSQGKSLFQIFNFLKKNKGRPSFSEVFKTVNLLGRLGAVEGINVPKTNSGRKILPLELGFSSRKNLLITLGMPEIAVKKLEVSIFFDNTFLSGYGDYPNNLKDFSEDIILDLIKSVFEFARENEVGGIFFKFFAGKEKTFSLAEKTARLCKEKGAEEFIETSFFFFTQWELISSNLLKDFRQLSAKLIFSLNGTGKFYEAESGKKFKEVKNIINFLKKEKVPFFVIAPITDENINEIKKTTSFLSKKNISFTTYFPFVFKKNYNIIFSEIYSSLSKKTFLENSFSAFLGRNFSLSKNRINNPYFIYYNKGGAIEEERFLEEKFKELDSCSKCEFKDLCAKSFSLRINYSSQKGDNILNCCSFYREIIPFFLEEELKNYILNK